MDANRDIFPSFILETRGTSEFYPKHLPQPRSSPLAKIIPLGVEGIGIDTINWTGDSYYTIIRIIGRGVQHFYKFRPISWSFVFVKKLSKPQFSGGFLRWSTKTGFSPTAASGNSVKRRVPGELKKQINDSNG